MVMGRKKPQNDMARQTQVCRKPAIRIIRMMILSRYSFSREASCVI
jgi:hypothetical protein